MRNLLNRKTWTLVLIIACTISSYKLSGKTIIVDFEQVNNGKILDSKNEQCAQLMGKAKIISEMKPQSRVLNISKVNARGVADFGKDFALSKTGTIEFKCKPRRIPGVIVGKYGAINIEFVKKEKSVRFGLKFKRGSKGSWVTCKSPINSIKIKQWIKIKASWGKYGLLLFLNDKLVAQTSLPASFDWFSNTGHFVLGSYTWPKSHKVWFLDGVIDDFSFSPTQEAPSVDDASGK